MKKERTVIRLGRDPGVVARAVDTAINLAINSPRKYNFNGYVNRMGYSVDEAVHYQHVCPVTIRVEADQDGNIPSSAYDNLIEALKECYTTPARHPILVEHGEDLNITDWDLELRVEGINSIMRRAA